MRSAQAPDDARLARETLDFIVRCGRADGGYAPSPDPAYAGNSDTKFSDLAAVTYAAVLAKTMGWDLPRKERSIAFIRKHQRPDGHFVNLAGKHDPASDLGILYNTTQGIVGLRALGAEPEIDPIPSVARLLAGEAYKKLPWYTTSFFPLLCAALEQAVSRRLARQARTAHGAEPGQRRLPGRSRRRDLPHGPLFQVGGRTHPASRSHGRPGAA